MSSQEGDPDTRQRTVAELLAQYGGGRDEEEEEGATRSGRRRRAEDTADDTAPQAIIDRVLSDSGSMRPVDESAQHTSRAQRRQAGDLGEPRDGRAGAPQQPQQPRPQPPQQQPPPQRPQQPPQQAQPQPPQAPPQQQPPPAGAPQPSGAANNGGPAVPARKQGGAQQQPKQPTRVMPPAGGQPGQQPPPAGRKPPDGSGLSARLAGGAPEPLTEQIDAVPDDDERDYFSEEDTGAPAQREPGDAGEEPDRRYRPRLLRKPRAGRSAAPEREDADGEQDLRDEDLRDEDLRDEDLGRDGHGADDEDDYDEDYDDEDYDEHHEPEPTTGKEWLTLIGLIAAGVVGGALVWLGFDWLWEYSKLVAGIAAVVVVVGIVLGVRKLWRARDVQTTVFAVVVGLIVTVSPAALLFLRG